MIKMLLALDEDDILECPACGSANTDIGWISQKCYCYDCGHVW